MKQALLAISFLALILTASAAQTDWVSDFRTYETSSDDKELYIGDSSDILQIRFNLDENIQTIYKVKYQVGDQEKPQFEPFSYGNETYGFGFIPEGKGDLLTKVTIIKYNISNSNTSSKTFSVDGYTLKEFPYIFDVTTSHGFTDLHADNHSTHIGQSISFDTPGSYYTTKKVSSEELDRLIVHASLGKKTDANITVTAFKNGKAIRTHEQTLFDGENTYDLEDGDANILPQDGRYNIRLEKSTPGKLTVKRLALKGKTSEPHQIKDPEVRDPREQDRGFIGGFVGWITALFRF